MPVFLRSNEPVRGQQAARVVSIIRVMSDGCFHRKLDLASRFNVTSRTILRDLEVAELAGFAIDQELNEQNGIPTGMYRLLNARTAAAVAARQMGGVR